LSDLRLPRRPKTAAEACDRVVSPVELALPFAMNQEGQAPERSKEEVSKGPSWLARAKSAIAQPWSRESDDKHKGTVGFWTRVYEKVEGTGKLAEHLFHIVIAVALIVLAIYVSYQVWNEKLEIQEVQVPKELEEAGYGPAIMADRIKTEIRSISKAVHTPDQPFFQLTSDDIAPDFEIPEAKLPVKSLVSVVRRWVGRAETQISGHIVRTGEHYEVTIRVQDEPELIEHHTATFHVPASDVHQAIARSAEAIIAFTDPLSLGRYYARTGDTRGAAELSRLIETSARCPLKRHQAVAAALTGIALTEALLDSAPCESPLSCYATPDAAFAAAEKLDSSIALIEVNAGIGSYAYSATDLLRINQSAAERNSQLQKSGVPFLNIAEVYQRQENYQKEIQYCQWAADAPSAEKETKARALERWAEALASQGVALQKSGKASQGKAKFDEARAKFQKSIEAMELGDSYLRWSTVLAHWNDSAGSSAANLQACQAKAPAVQGCLAYAFDLLRDGAAAGRTQALQLAARALRMRPSDPAVLLQVGQIEDQIGHLAEAEADYEAARQLSPTSARKSQAHKLLYDVLLRDGKPREAARLGVPVGGW